MMECKSCQFYNVDYKFDTEYLSLMTYEICTKKNKIFSKDCEDYLEKGGVL